MKRIFTIVLLPLLSLCVEASATTKSTDDLLGRLAQDRTIVCAHRGWLAPDRPENSLRTMRQTRARGPFMLEMDLAVARDGSIVMMHDSTIDRTTDGTGSVAALDEAALRRVHLRPQGGVPTTDKPPFFSDILAWSRRDPATLLMLDIKRTPPALVMDRVRHAGITNRVLLLTFDPATATAAFAADPDVLVSVLVTNPADLDFYRSLAGPRRFAAYIPLDQPEALFALAHAQHDIVVTDLLDRHNALAERYAPADLHDRQVDILVTNHPLETTKLLKLASSRGNRS